jgi:hypothetical protein
MTQGKAANGVPRPPSQPAPAAWRHILLKPPADEPPSAISNGWRDKLVWGLLGGLTLLACAVVWLLPNWLAPTKAPTLVASAIAPPPAFVPALADDKQEARTAEAAGQTLRESQSERFNQALAAALRALQENDWEQAAAQLGIALAIVPEHAQAAALLSRVRQRPRLLEGMRQAAQLEANGELNAARQAYAEAQQLDSEYLPARQAFERLNRQLTGQGFSTAMQAAFEALAASDLTAAENALRQAATLKPQDPALADARQRLAAARHATRVSAWRRQAAAKAQAEDWAGAAALYDRLLAAEPGALAAQRGAEQAQSRLAWHQRLQQMLVNPQRLYEPAVRRDAEQMLAALAETPAGEPLLKAKIERLRDAVETAKQPLTLTLRSDGQTEVSIQRIGLIGRFQRRDIELLPGRYILVGARIGYRDVRESIFISPERPLEPVTVQCQEPI